MKYETKEKSLKIEELFANITYYKLWARKHFGYYIIGLGDKGYRVSSTEEILNQAFVILKANQRGGASGVDESYRVLRGQSKAL